MYICLIENDSSVGYYLHIVGGLFLLSNFGVGYMFWVLGGFLVKKVNPTQDEEQ